MLGVRGRKALVPLILSWPVSHQQLAMVLAQCWEVGCFSEPCRTSRPPPACLPANAQVRRAVTCNMAAAFSRTEALSTPCRTAACCCWTWRSP